MNLVILMGRTTKEPEIRRSTTTDSIVARFTLAINQGKDNTAFIDCVAFGKTAEFAEKYMQKGSMYMCQGRINPNTYTNKNGEKVYQKDIVIDHIEFGESRREAAGPQLESVPDIPEELPFE